MMAGKTLALISIIDDDAGARIALAALLRSTGHVVNTFASAYEFLNWDQLAQSQCVITDLKMSGMDGLELQRRLISDGHQFPIIFVTGTTDCGCRTQALEAGAFAYFVKPYSGHQLIDSVARALTC
jgi:FixJ family two-component response regulator